MPYPKIIVAADLGDGIGKSGGLPWPRIQSDMTRFASLTKGGSLIMGRKTFESIGKPLPGRQSVVLSKDSSYRPEGALVESSLRAGIYTASRHGGNLWIIGGSGVFTEALAFAEEIYLTRVHHHFDCDVFFPKVSLGQWKLVDSRQELLRDQYPTMGVAFEVYHRSYTTDDEFRARG